MKPYPDPLPTRPSKPLIKQFSLSYDCKGLSKQAVATFNRYVHDVLHARDDLAPNFKLRIVNYRATGPAEQDPLGYRRFQVKATQKEAEDLLAIELVPPILGALKRLRFLLSSEHVRE